MSSGQAIRPELANAVTRGAGIKTLPGLDVATQIIPVMVVEDVSKGPFPPSRIWHAGIGVAGVAAMIAHIGIVNNDPPGTGSGLTVDYIIARVGTADDLFVVVGQNIPTLNLQKATVGDCSNEAGGLPAGSAFDPRVGQAFIAAAQNGVGLNGVLWPNGGTLPQRLDGPWTLGPQAALIVRTATVNVILQAYFRGRYHAGI